MLAHGCMTDTFLFSNERLCQTLESNRPFLSAEPLKDGLHPQTNEMNAVPWLEHHLDDLQHSRADGMSGNEKHE